MGTIEQKYAWSESRVKCLRECRWKYHLTYNVAWEGWRPSAPQEKQRAYLLKNMTNLPMFVGSVVHDTIEEIINTGKDSGKWITLEQAQDIALQKLRKGWKQSVEKRWQGGPKNNVNLAEHYYQEPITKEQTEKYKHKVLTSLKAFYDMPLFNVIQNVSKDSWLTLEDFQQFTLNTGEEVSVKIDCGFKHDGKVYLLDWKTGRVSDSVIDQLTTYAMYAIKKEWTKKPDNIVIVPVYLAYYLELGEQAIPQLNVTLQQMRRQANTIRSEYPLLKEAFANKDNQDFFAKTDNENVCKKCSFRDMCGGAKTTISDGETPF